MLSLNTGFMHSIERDYQDVSGLKDRKLYKIFYSHVYRSSLLVLGINPGGNPSDSNMSASSSYFENGEHDYADFKDNPKYSIAAPMYKLLYEVLGSDSLIRHTPKTNLIFRRSPSLQELQITLEKAITECIPYVEKIIDRVQPRAIILEANQAFDIFSKYYCNNSNPSGDEEIYTPNGKHVACIYRRDFGDVRALSRKVQLITIGHPSRYGRRKEFVNVIQRCKSALKSEL